MRWFYKKIKQVGNKYTYLYSHENKDYDGIIEYDANTKIGRVVKACADDKDSKFAMDWSYMHFYDVIDDNFPEYRAVITG